MPLSRRQFFRNLWSPNEKSRHQRLARYEIMETYVRTSLLPYDFGLTAGQETELFAEVRAALERTSDEDLFSWVARTNLEVLVDRKVNVWRDEQLVQSGLDRLKEIREAAADYVAAFLSVQASRATVEQLKKRVGVSDPEVLEAELRNRIRAWIETVEDDRILHYDVFTVKDLVFAQLRSWC